MTEVAKKTKSDGDYKDELEEMLKRTGCIELHYAVQVMNNFDCSYFFK